MAIQFAFKDKFGDERPEGYARLVGFEFWDKLGLARVHYHVWPSKTHFENDQPAIDEKVIELRNEHFDAVRAQMKSAFGAQIYQLAIDIKLPTGEFTLEGEGENQVQVPVLKSPFEGGKIVA